MAHSWSSAYYLAGYAVECGLKSCVLARVATAPEVIFDDKRYSEKCWTHNIEELVKLADLEAARNADTVANPVLGSNWLIVKDWNEKSRYEIKTQPQAQQLYDAIAELANGVMQWIRLRW
jgi:hypothetical protein